MTDTTVDEATDLDFALRAASVVAGLEQLRPALSALLGEVDRLGAEHDARYGLLDLDEADRWALDRRTGWGQVYELVSAINREVAGNRW